MPEAKRPRTEAPWARWDQSSENDSAAPRPAPPVLAAPAASAAPGRRGPQRPRSSDAWVARQNPRGRGRIQRVGGAPRGHSGTRAGAGAEAAFAYDGDSRRGETIQSAGAAVVVDCASECHLEDLQKRDKGDYYWSTLADLSVERIARESLFKWFESELLSGFEDDRRIKNLGYGFRGLCREVERRIRMLTTPVAAPAPEPSPTPRPALPPSRIRQHLRAARGGEACVPGEADR